MPTYTYSLLMQQKKLVISTNKKLISSAQKKIEHLNESLKCINEIYDKHCTIFKSVNVSRLCNGCGISLVSVNQFASEANTQFKGRSQSNCMNELEKEIEETKREIKNCQNLIDTYQRLINEAQQVINQLQNSGG